jgi:hypothetical protein
LVRRTVQQPMAAMQAVPAPPSPEHLQTLGVKPAFTDRVDRPDPHSTVIKNRACLPPTLCWRLKPCHAVVCRLSSPHNTRTHARIKGPVCAQPRHSCQSSKPRPSCGSRRGVRGQSSFPPPLLSCRACPPPPAALAGHRARLLGCPPGPAGQCLFLAGPMHQETCLMVHAPPAALRCVGTAPSRNMSQHSRRRPRRRPPPRAEGCCAPQQRGAPLRHERAGNARNHPSTATRAPVARRSLLTMFPARSRS